MNIRSKNHKGALRRWLVLGLLASCMTGGASYSFAQEGAVDGAPPLPSPVEDLGLESVTPDDSALTPAPEAPVSDLPSPEPSVVSEAELGLGDDPAPAVSEVAPAPEAALAQVTAESEDPFAEPAPAPAADAPQPAEAQSVETPPAEAPSTDAAVDAPAAEVPSDVEAPTAEAPAAEDSGLSGLEIADDKPAEDTEARAPVPGDAMPPPPPKTEQGFQEMLNRKGGAKSPSADVLKKTVAESEGKPFNPSKIRSLFFTHWQHEALLDAKKSRGNVRPPTQGELNALGTVDKVKPENRDLSLNGIVFVNDEDWTIWLNGMRVTPSAIPREVIDLRVYKEYIEVKWLDDYTNQIYPIRLRAHQRFNLDARIFLPG